ncbi:MAG: alpha/beta hydrolase [Spirochaetia bacterium]|jgi:phospholipase/carboxylesterase/glyoxalase family protein
MNDRQSLKEPGFIHRFIPAAAEGAPTLLLLHGTGGDEDNLIELGRLVAPGAALLSPRGKVLENGMPRFFRRLAEGVFDLEDLRFRTVELAEFVDTAARAYGVEPSSMVAAGYSNGANIAASLLLLKPGALAAAVLFHAMVPIVPDPLPDLKGVPVFLTGGKQDTMIAPRETERLARLLESAGASVQLAWQPGGHGLSRPEMEAAREWLRGI